MVCLRQWSAESASGEPVYSARIMFLLLFVTSERFLPIQAQQSQVLVCPPPYKPSYKERCAQAHAKAAQSTALGSEGAAMASKDELWKVFLGDVWPTVETSAVIDKVGAMGRDGVRKCRAFVGVLFLESF
eukprot:SAG31_NODE_4698_length_3026_cov_1.767680_2_plen_130_part_00